MDRFPFNPCFTAVSFSRKFNEILKHFSERSLNLYVCKYV